MNTNKNGIKKKGVSDRLVLLIGLAFFLEVGIEMTVTGWFPSYGVLTNTFSAESAALCGTLFWTMLTIFRFTIANSNRKISTNLFLLVSMIVICSLISTFLHLMGWFTVATLFGSIVFGMSCSGCYSLMMTLPVEFGMKLKP